MAMGSPPVVPQRHRLSQGWWQTREQTEGKGFAARIAR